MAIVWEGNVGNETGVMVISTPITTIRVPLENFKQFLKISMYIDSEKRAAVASALTRLENRIKDAIIDIV